MNTTYIQYVAKPGAFCLLKFVHVCRLTRAAHVMRSGTGASAEKALEQSLAAHEKEDQLERAKVSKEAQAELRGFDVPFTALDETPPVKKSAKKTQLQSGAKSGSKIPVAKAAAVVKKPAQKKVERAQSSKTLSMEKACWQTGKGCGALMDNLSSQSQKVVNAKKAVEKPAKKSPANTKAAQVKKPSASGEKSKAGLVGLSKELGSVLSW
jgi:hypothetical protein